MSGLASTGLTTNDKVDLAASSLALQGVYGAVMGLSEEFGVSRPTVYTAREEARRALHESFDPEARAQRLAAVVVDERQLERAVIALRVVGHNSLRAVEDLLPILYPGLQVSYGKIQSLLVTAEHEAADFNQTVGLSAVEAVAVDEMFSQGDPVLAGVDLDSGFVFALEKRTTRSAEDWREVLESCKPQGLDLKVVVKDAALGIAAGVREAFPEAEQRDDCFHAHYAIGKVVQVLERRAWGSIASEIQVEKDLDKMKRTLRGDRKQRQSLDSKLAHARRRCREVLELHDAFVAAADGVREALEVVDLDTGRLRSDGQMERLLVEAAAAMQSLSSSRCRKVGRYLENRAPGLVKYARALNEALAQLGAEHDDDTVRIACIIERLRADLNRHTHPWRRRDKRQLLYGACATLKHLAGDLASVVLADVQRLMVRRHRASSAIEGFNAALRPHLYVHKGVTQGFLELYRAYYNLRTRRWGRHKGTSAYECLHGAGMRDWLGRLGYSPTSALN